MPIAHPAFKQIACVLMGAALFLIAGGHMALLQGIAWTTMVHDFSKTASLSQAVEKTFDGKHLCPLCKKIAKERADQEKAPLSVKAEKKAVVFVAHSDSELPFPTCRPLNYPSVPSVFPPERTDAPPVPVPIRSLA